MPRPGLPRFDQPLSTRSDGGYTGGGRRRWRDNIHHSGGKGPCRAGFGDSRPRAMTPPCPFCKSLHVEHLNDHGGFVCFGCGWWFVLDVLGNCLDQGPTQHAALWQRR